MQTLILIVIPVGILAVAGAAFVYLESRRQRQISLPVAKGSFRISEPEVTRILSELAPLEERCAVLETRDPIDDDVFAEKKRIREDIRRLLGSLIERYLESDFDLRRQIRDFFHGRGDLCSFLEGQVSSAARQLRETNDPSVLRKGVAAVSILDTRTDFREVLHPLADLYQAAKEAGLPADQCFEEVAAMSAAQGNYHGLTSMRDFIRSFKDAPGPLD